MPRKRSNGEGSLHKRSNGLWEWQIMVGYQPDGKRKMKSFYGRTQKEVKEKAAKYLEDLRAAPEISKEMAFTDWADTIATNMAGRGTDIMLGGNADFLAKTQLEKSGLPEELIREADSYAETDNPEILAVREQYKTLLKQYKEEIAQEAELVRQAGGRLRGTMRWFCRAGKPARPA